MLIHVNGLPHELTEETPSVHQLLQSLDIAPEEKGIAVALNLEVIPRSLWKETLIQERDSLEIVHARQGG